MAETLAQWTSHYCLQVQYADTEREPFTQYCACSQCFTQSVEDISVSGSRRLAQTVSQLQQKQRSENRH